MKRLKEKIELSNRKSYGFYKSFKGSYSFGDFKLTIDHVQGDPYAAPSMFSIAIPLQATGFPEDWYSQADGCIPLGDFITRQLFMAFSILPKTGCSGNSGKLFIPKPGQQILPRSAVCFEKGQLIVRFRAGLPAKGRTIDAVAAMRLFFANIPDCIALTCFYVERFKTRLPGHIQIYRRQQELRQLLAASGLIAFIPDGALLPRRAGRSDLPLDRSDAVPFKSPPEMTAHFKLKDGTELSGMGIKSGINLIVGGGFHGKSTLLKALQFGIYPHVQGDGREFVCTNKTAVKIRSENGRVVNNVNIEPFIKGLPNGVDTCSFSSENASGSTSQASDIMETVNLGAEVLLMDEDTCATNFMVRDEIMRRLIPDEEEPITPFLFRVTDLYRNLGVSTVLVMGGVGGYLSCATEVIGINNYLPTCLTGKARKIGMQSAEERQPENPQGQICYADKRCLLAESEFLGGTGAKVKCKDLVTLRVGDLEVDIRNLEQLVSEEQGVTLGYLIKEIFKRNRMLAFDDISSMVEAIQYNDFSFIREKRGNFAAVRALDLACVLNRSPGLKIFKKDEPQG